MLSRIDIPAPPVFGAPSAFSSWRPAQADAVTRILESTKRFTAINAPTGIGKSMIAIMVQLMTGCRVVVLTSTRGLQDLYLRGWSAAGLFDMRGQRNHECLAVREDGPLARYHRGASAVMVDRAPCHAGVWCPLKHRGGCTYYDDQKTAASADLVTTNYAYWITAGPTLGRFDYVVMDEADEADAEVRKALHLELHHPKLRQLLQIDPLPATASIDRWREWAVSARRKAADVINDFTEELHREEAIDQQTVYELRQLQQLEDTLGRIGNLKGRWLISPNRRGPITDFDPIWPGPYCEEMLYRGAERIVMMSATLTRKDLEILAVPDRDSEFIEYDSPFAVKNRPIYIINFGENRVRVDSRLKDSGYRWLVGLMDSAIQNRLDRKQLIQSVSYKLTQRILSLSRFGKKMVTHEDSDEKPRALEDFRRAVAGGSNSILISPSVRVGESFPMRECEVIHVPKIPFLDMRDPIMRLREEEDEDYGGHLMMKALAQSVGRHVRSTADRGESLVYDDHARWSIPRYRKYAPKSMMKAVKWVHSIPEPLAKL
jgi:Rad3-related DNA helicase